ncbi:MAG: tRNA pseudouridine(55) synthase TruB [Alphaproteobacteria bacterium]|nr:MAG: tRNA pseudouridine(55) synthase TruB [Alphaproteobacteria bacterium]
MARNKKGIPIHGWLNLDKPLGMTSTQALGRVRRILNAQKLGHAGTLDPLATGILPIALGEATKTIQYAQDRDKVYRFTVKWGEARNTDDCEGTVIATSDKRPTEADIRALLPRFTGNIDQVPPQFSAIKLDGERAYDLARAGEKLDIQPRRVTVYGFKLLNSTPNEAEFELECGKGTYVRSIARDMGQILGCYGHVSALRRLAVGNFTENTSISLDEFEKLVQSAAPDQVLLPVETVLDDIPALAMTAEEVGRIRQGQTLKFLSRQDVDRLSATGIDERTILVLAMGDNKPLALLEKDGIALYPVKVFNL